MLVTLQDEATVRVSGNRNPDAVFRRVCEQNPNLRVEQTRDGEIVIMSPTGYKNSDRNLKILVQLFLWAGQDGRGSVSESNTLFLLPDGSKLGPDAAWISREKLSRFSETEIADFLPVVPEFIIELRSKSDRFKDLRKKMKSWIANGVQLGWLIDADERRVWIYTPQAEPRELTAPSVILGEGPLAGFQLEMEKIYQGLKW